VRTRPLNVTLIACLALLFAALNLARFVQAITLWDLLAELLLIWPGYLVITSLVWFPTGAVLAWGLLYGRAWARRLAPAVFIIYSAYTWAERLVLPGDRLRNENWLFVAGLNIVILGWSIWVMSRRRVIDFFEEQHGR
jgi:hypothetical protein